MMTLINSFTTFKGQLDTMRRFFRYGAIQIGQLITIHKQIGKEITSIGSRLLSALLFHTK